MRRWSEPHENRKELSMEEHDRLRGRILDRRGMLGLLGMAGIGLLAGRVFAQTSRPSAGPLSCVATPEQTEGPYFVDERLLRSDIRTDPADNSMKQGVPLLLRLTVSTIGKSGCSPLTGAMVDIWHCDAIGLYSDIAGGRQPTAGRKFLRGYQITDGNGMVRFTTIYPGWYPGRTVHIHFKIRTPAKAGRAGEFTSQLYFDDAVTARVHAGPPYAGRAGNRTSNGKDGIFRDGGNQLMLRLAESDGAYTADFHIGLLGA
jgi:protocatechuate 3,4-dioxygenase beta subunit